MSDLHQPPKARILIADDEPLYLKTTGALLRKAGYDCVCVADANAAIAALRNEPFDLILSDLNMPGNLRLELLREGRTGWPDVPVIVITGVPSLPTAIESLRLGITDYLLKPVRYEDLLASIQKSLGSRALKPTDAAVDNQVPESSPDGRYPEIIGSSPAMQRLFDILDRVCRTDANVLITGESGTGKEVIARTIHQNSARRNHPFCIIDCTAIPESLFESVLFGHVKGSFTGAVKDQAGLLPGCHHGTAFFDEIGELPMPLQAKLLRVVQEQTFTPVGKLTPEHLETRFVCATNRDLATEITAGRFRQDLFYRLAVIPVELPPLRERGDDVVLLAEHFLKQLQQASVRVAGFSQDALACLRRHSWPGNVRELRNVVERSLAFARNAQVEESDLPESVRVSPSVPVSESSTNAGRSRDDALDDAERHYLESLLQAHGGNVSKAAQQAGVSRQGMYKMLNKHGIAAAEFRD
jgi:two-component system response regulator AtoC